MDEIAQEQAAALLEVVPLVMRFMRAEARKRRGEELTVPQFRILAFLGRHARVSLSEIAEFIGITLPGASQMVDVLVRKKLACRDTSLIDRRCIELTLTPEGKRIYQNARRATLARLTEVLANLNSPSRMKLTEILGELKPLFLQQIEDAGPRVEGQTTSKRRTSTTRPATVCDRRVATGSKPS